MVDVFTTCVVWQVFFGKFDREAVITVCVFCIGFLYIISVALIASKHFFHPLPVAIKKRSRHLQWTKAFNICFNDLIVQSSQSRIYWVKRKIQGQCNQSWRIFHFSAKSGVAKLLNNLMVPRGRLYLRFGCAVWKAFMCRMRFQCHFQCQKLKNDVKTHSTVKHISKLHIQNASVIDPLTNSFAVICLQVCTCKIQHVHIGGTWLVIVRF
jgi:hypothetical protein